MYNQDTFSKRNYKNTKIILIIILITLLFCLNAVNINNPNDYKFIKYNTYHIYINNQKDYYTNKIFLLLPGDKCTDNTKKTYFFKPNYPKMSSKYITYQKKKVSLQSLSDESVSEPSLFTQDPNETREQLLKKLGFKINTNMNIYNLYMTPYSIDDKFKSEMNEFIIDKYQRLNNILMNIIICLIHILIQKKKI